jgi:hypothetical protein
MGTTGLSLLFTCGTSMIQTLTFQYDATPTTLTLYVGEGRVDTYTKE